MNKIVREHYPVAKLPEDLRVGLGGVEAATVTVEATDMPTRRSLQELLEAARRMRQEGVIGTVSAEEAVDRIRELRDEWD